MFPGEVPEAKVAGAERPFGVRLPTEAFIEFDRAIKRYDERVGVELVSVRAGALSVGGDL